jgi:hypothetical protein
MSPKIQRNDPCPCGSGKKYKNCCWIQERNFAHEKNQDTLRALEEQDFSSLEEVQAFVQQQMQRQNETPEDDFEGLSPGQMYRLLHHPLSSPEVVRIQPPQSDVSSVPVIRLFLLIANEIGSSLKPTSTGNLPRNVSRRITKAFMGEPKYAKYSRLGEIRSELEFYPLHITRIVGELAKLIRKYRGRFILSRDCRKLLEESDRTTLYLRLFETFTTQYNWSYWHDNPPLPILQQSFLYTLYLLQRHGDRWRNEEYYQDAFLRAFPSAINTIESTPYITPVERLRRQYSRRVLDDFTTFLGFSQKRPVAPTGIERQYEYKALSLLNEMIDFRLR